MTLTVPVLLLDQATTSPLPTIHHHPPFVTSPSPRHPEMASLVAQPFWFPIPTQKPSRSQRLLDSLPRMCSHLPLLASPHVQLPHTLQRTTRPIHQHLLPLTSRVPVTQRQPRYPRPHRGPSVQHSPMTTILHPWDQPGQPLARATRSPSGLGAVEQVRYASGHEVGP